MVQIHIQFEQADAGYVRSLSKTDLMGIVANSTSTRLNFSNLHLNDEGVRVVASVLKEVAGVTHLSLRNTGFSCAGAQCLAQFLRNDRFLQVLDLRENNIRMVGARELANELYANNTLNQLLLQHNPIHASLAQVFHTLQKGRPGLTIGGFPVPQTAISL